MVTKKATKKTQAKSASKATSKADGLWDEIKELPIEMFSLDNQRVLDHVTRKGGTPTSVVLGLRSPAALPALEAALKTQKQYRKKVSFAMKAEGENVSEAFPKYEMEEAEGYVIVRRFVPPTDRPELQDLAPVFIAGKEEK